MINVYTDGGCIVGKNIGAYAFVVCVENIISNVVGARLNNRMTIITNNGAEYAAIINALEWLNNHELNSAKVTIYSDSELVVKQINGEYDCKDDLLMILNNSVYLGKCLLKSRGIDVEFVHIRRDSHPLNTMCDGIVKKIMG